MRQWFLAILIIFAAHSSALAQTSHIDIVLDIDWTGFYSVDASQKDEKTVLVEGKLYRPTDHLTEVLELLMREHPEVRISFFSGGERSRNETLLKSILLSDGRSLFDIAHRIFSKEHLTVISTDPQLKFAARYKKSLEKVFPEWNPARTILIDDQVEFAKPPLKAVSSFGTFNFQKQFDSSKATESFFPPNEAAWKMERQKALVWLALIDAALAESEKGTVSFADAAKKAWPESIQNELLLQKGKILLRQSSGLSCQKVFALQSR